MDAFSDEAVANQSVIDATQASFQSIAAAAALDRMILTFRRAGTVVELVKNGCAGIVDQLATHKKVNCLDLISSHWAKEPTLVANLTGTPVIGAVMNLLSSAVALRLGLASWSGGMRWPHLVGIGFLGGIGFTTSLFIADLAFESGTLRDEAKLGILVGSLFAAVIGVLLLGSTPSSASSDGETCIRRDGHRVTGTKSAKTPGNPVDYDSPA